MRARTLRVALCPLEGAEGPRFRVLPGGDSFVARDDCAPVDTGRLVRITETAAREGVAVLLLPELHVRPEEVGALRGAAILTVAGSFHVPDGEMRNRAPVLVDGGHALWEHDKRGLFRLKRRDVLRRGAPFTPSGEVSDVIVEGIVGGGPLTVLDTSLGRLAVIICADALDPDGYVRAVEDARPDLLFVVSMSSETGPFEDRAAEWERLGISMVYVNAGPDGALQGLCWLAVHGARDMPPTRVRWRGGPVETWRPGEEWSAGAGGVAWVDPELGLVVDLAAMVSDGKDRPESVH